MTEVLEKIKEKVKKSPLVKLKKFVWHIFYALTAFFMGSISFAGTISPFSAAFVSAATPEFLLPTALGAAAGYLVFCTQLTALQYVGAVTVICFVKYFTQRSVKPFFRMYIYTLTGFLALLFSSILISIAGGAAASQLLVCLCESLICAAVSCFFYKIFIMFSGGLKKIYFTSSETAAFLFFVGVLLLLLDGFPVFGVSVSHIAAGFVILLFSYCGKEASGSLSGVCCGVTLGFSEFQPQLMLSYPLSGLLSGFSAEYGKGAAAAGFFISQMLALVIRGNPDAAAFTVGESLASVLIFMLIPKAYLKKAAERLSPLSRDAFENEAVQILSFRIKKSARAVSDMAQSVMTVSSALAKTEATTVSSIYLSVKEDVCECCSKRELCWYKNGKTTEQAFRQANSYLVKKGKISSELLPERVRAFCEKTDEIAESFSRNMCEYNANEAVKHKLLQTKALVSAQLLSVGRLLEDTVENVNEVFYTDAVSATYAREVFLQEGFSFSSLLARTDSLGRSFLEVFCTAFPENPDYVHLCEELYLRTDIQYMLPERADYGDAGTVLSFCEKTVFTPEFSCFSHTGTGEKFCGDTCRSFFDGKGNFYVILSDGMGSGQRAALDSLMTASLLHKLLIAGFSVECAAENINCALMIKSDDETLATLDVLKINLYTGKAEFYKAGAAFSVVKKGERTALVEQSSLPLGIIKDAQIKKTQLDLSERDCVLLISDGAAVLAPEQFKKIFHSKKADTPEKKVRAVVEHSLEMSVSGRNDDITAAFVRLKRS